jgi:CRISPR type III-B/RAMP module-associated protein Cmr3
MSEMASKVFNWVNTRLPIVNTFERHLSKHPVPKKVNFWYLFGALASVVLIIQIVTGIWLIMPYSNTNRLRENVKLVALLEERGSKETTLKGSYYFGGETRISKIETQPLDERLEFLTDCVEIERGNIYRFYLTTHTYIEDELTIGRCLNIGGLNFELVWLFNAGKEWISGFRKPAIQMLKPGTVLILKALQPGELRRLTYIGQTEFVPVYENRESTNILRKKVKLHNYGWNFGILGPYKGG